MYTGRRVGQGIADTGQPTTDLSAWIGRVIEDRYRIVEVLGEGGMGAVFVADHLRLHKQVALKIIRAEFAEHSQAEARFEREAMATAKIDHPHVASAIDFGRLPEGGAFLVLALVRGEHLGKRLRRGALPWPEVCVLGAQIADALATAHAAGIIHRDLKPENVLLEARGDGSLHAKVVDFGIARVSGEHGGVVAAGAEPITRLGAVIGSPGYMAPEQAVGGPIDHRVDLYALGVILWECCTGQPLWEADSISELFTSQLSRAAPSLRTGLADALPGDLAGLIDQLLARTAAQRPATAAGVRDQLRRIAREAGPVAVPDLAAPATGHSPVTRGGTTLGDRPAGRSKRPLLWAAAALVLLGLGFVALRPGAPETPATPAPPHARAEQTPPVKQVLPSRKELLAELPDALTDAAQALLLGDDPGDRQQAGAAIVAAAASGAIPQYLHNLARLETAADCDQRRPVLQQIAAAGDVRVLWGLRILDRARPPGFACVRDELARITATLEAAAG